jgi:hypothetical protein
MARLARVVGPRTAHHITQRGNRWEETFFGAEDYQAYIGLMREWCEDGEGLRRASAKPIAAGEGLEGIRMRGGPRGGHPATPPP